MGNEKLEEEAKLIMKETAKRQTTISYTDIASRLGNNIKPRSKLLADLITKASEEEFSANGGEAILSVVVVYKDYPKMPGNGFFSLANRLRDRCPNKEACFLQELARAHNYYKNKT